MGLCLVAIGCGGNGPGVATPNQPCVTAAQPGEVCIAGGVFEMGHDKISDPRGASSDLTQLQTPAHKVSLTPFFIDERPVSNGEYLACFNAGACPDECQTAATVNSVGAGGCGKALPLYQTYHFRDPALDRYPVATVFDSGAEAYCRSVGKRLPTEAEWERAARGPGDHDYPWGDVAPDCSRWGCNVASLTNDSTSPFTPVGTYPVDLTTGDVSPEGARMMVTGVAEFLHDWYYDYPFDNGQAIPEPTGDPNTNPGYGQAARGNLLVQLPLYKGHVDNVPPDQALEPFPQPGWARGPVGWTLVGGIRCARDDG